MLRGAARFECYYWCGCGCGEGRGEWVQVNIKKNCFEARHFKFNKYLDVESDEIGIY
jgi:hypothetical protein